MGTWARFACFVGGFFVAFLSGCEAPISFPDYRFQTDATTDVEDQSAPDSDVPTQCPVGMAECDGDPGTVCETNTQSSVQHCGTCGHACQGSKMSGRCVDGSCACAAGYADCNMDVSDGCETSTTEENNCGSCGNVCSLAFANSHCAAGVCVVDTCADGYANCDGVASNGCETPTVTAENCGSCNHPCAPGNAVGSCSSGRCEVVMCDAGFGDCDRDVLNGCEVDTSSSLDNCGACGRRCAPPNAVPACVVGACAIVSCLDGFADCDHDPTNGCEVDTRTSPSNCGTCGFECRLRNAVAACSASRCVVDSCVGNFGNCNRDNIDGCEVNLDTDTDNCGRCGNGCTPPAGRSISCMSGTCVPSAMCAAGLGDCDSNGSCETNLSADPSNCVRCGGACDHTNGTATCSASGCGIVCAGSYGDCNRNASDGCETNLATDLSNCRACGTVCSAPTNATPTCSTTGCGWMCNTNYHPCGGACVSNYSTASCGGACAPCPARANATTTCNGSACGFACLAGFVNCNGIAADGCEVATSSFQTDRNNCGGCGVVCRSGASCVDRQCVRDYPLPTPLAVYPLLSATSSEADFHTSGTNGVTLRMRLSFSVSAGRVTATACVNVDESTASGTSGNTHGARCESTAPFGSYVTGISTSISQSVDLTVWRNDIGCREMLAGRFAPTIAVQRIYCVTDTAGEDVCRASTSDVNNCAAGARCSRSSQCIGSGTGQCICSMCTFELGSVRVVEAPM